MLSEIFTIINNYFDSPIMTKISNDDNRFSIYMCKLNIHLSNTHRFLICIAPRDAFFIGSTCPLKDLTWKVFQTRTLPNKYPMIKSTHSYQPKHSHPYNTSIKEVSRTTKEVIYSVKNIPEITITLLQNIENIYEYPREGLINSALETYNTLIIVK